MAAQVRNRRGPSRRLILAALVAMVFVAPVLPARSEPNDVEARVKAAFLYNFVRFVEWPPESLGDPRTPVVIGIVGHDPLGSVLDEIVDGKTVGGRPIRIRRFDSVEQADHCQVLYIAEPKRGKTLRQSLAGKAVLSVGDYAGALQDGNVIAFLLVDDSVRFEISLETAGRAGLKISSQLLKVALNSPGR
jgi:hypothetical protein